MTSNCATASSRRSLTTTCANSSRAASSDSRPSSARISVPLPTPDGPVMTKTRANRRALSPQHRDELFALALGEPADRLARGDLARAQDLVDLHAPVLRHREQHVDHLGRLDVVGRVEQQLVDRVPATLEILLEPRPL